MKEDEEPKLSMPILKSDTQLPELDSLSCALLISDVYRGTSQTYASAGDEVAVVTDGMNEVLYAPDSPDGDMSRTSSGNGSHFVIA